MLLTRHITTALPTLRFALGTSFCPRLILTNAQQAAADLARIKAETLPIPAGVQTALAEHYQALLHTNDFYQYLTLFKELGQKQTQQQSRGRKINAMDAYFYQMVERVLREELAVVFRESPEEAGRRLLSVLN